MRGVWQIVIGALVLAAPTGAQINSTQAMLAGMREDIALLQQEVARLRLEVQQVTRENEQMRAELGNVASGARLAELAAELRRSFAAADASNRSEIVATFSQQLEALAARTEKALRALADASGSAPSLPETITFTDDYPKEGVAYTVQSGDTLSGIAREMNSSVTDIQNANRIADPAKLQVGQTLFIPQRND